MTAWDRVADDRSHVRQMYLFEINRQARTCRAACDQVLRLGERLRIGQHLEASDLEEIGERVEQAISCAAALRNLIYGNGGSKEQHLKKFGKERVRWIQGLMDNPTLPTIENVSARNSLEHFDERMDSWAYEWAYRSAEELGWVGAFDCIVKERGLWGQPGGDAELVRCYIADEAVFVVRRDEVHIPTLMAEADTVVRRTRQHSAAHTAMWKTSGAAPQIIIPF